MVGLIVGLGEEAIDRSLKTADRFEGTAFEPSAGREDARYRALYPAIRVGGDRLAALEEGRPLDRNIHKSSYNKPISSLIRSTHNGETANKNPRQTESGIFL
jgi:hypothetical protein